MGVHFAVDPKNGIDRCEINSDRESLNDLFDVHFEYDNTTFWINRKIGSHKDRIDVRDSESV